MCTAKSRMYEPVPGFARSQCLNLGAATWTLWAFAQGPWMLDKKLIQPVEGGPT